jgi:ubiquinone/menaquinone biosynthesis C-methylase UbiE
MTDLMTVPDTGPVPATTRDEERRDLLSGRLFEAFLAGAELLTVELGRRLDLYRVVRDRGPVTASELARHAGIGSRYAREWLEQQGAAGFLDVVTDDARTASVDPVLSGSDAGESRFALPAAHEPVLLSADDPANTVGFAPFLAGLGVTLPAVAQAYLSGTGVAYDRFGMEVRHGIGLGNRPMFTTGIKTWLARMPDITDRLRVGGAVLDLGCGTGWSSITIARTFPAVRVDALDLDDASIEEARAAARAEGVADRVGFVRGNAADLPVLPGGAGGYDLVTVFEALHDMGDPVSALAGARAVLAPGGAILVADERVSEEYSAPAGEVDRLMYAASVLHCLPATIAESPHTANGTVLRSSTVRAWAAAAGLRVSELPIDNLVWRFYRLDPV